MILKTETELAARFSIKGADVTKVVAASSQLEVHQKIDGEQHETFPERKAKRTHIHWYLLKDKGTVDTMLERLTDRIVDELRIETNNVCLMTCFEKTRGSRRR